MNLAATMRPHFASPVAAFLEFPDTDGYVEDPTLADTPDKQSLAWLTAQKRLANKSKPWRIDHASSWATTIYAVPTFLMPELAPKQIAICIPSQLKWPSHIRASLDAAHNAHQLDSRAAHLGIAEYLRIALSYWSSTSINWTERYQSLPFGSSIVLTAIEYDLTQCHFEFVCSQDAWSAGCSLSRLKTMWCLPDVDIPNVIHLDQLQFIRQLNDTVALVRLTNDSSQTQFVLKAPQSYTASIYHELKMFLTLPHSPVLAAKPHFVVGLDSGSDGEDIVCGLLLHYYMKGSMDDILPERRLAGKLEMSAQLGWCLDITRALMSIQSFGQFYSDLKLDNVVLNGPDEQESAVLIDFELDRNIFGWAPPEVLAVEWVGEIATSGLLDQSTKVKYEDLAQRFLCGRGMSFPPKTNFDPYHNETFGFYYPWVLSTVKEREAGMVYCLGKAIWCVFEGMGEVSNGLGRSSMFDNPLEFPDFCRTPSPIRKLIQNCTLGSREWSGRRLGLYRQGSRIYPRNASGNGPQLDATVLETKQAIKETWRKEVSEAEAMLGAKVRLDAGSANDSDLQRL